MTTKEPKAEETAKTKGSRHRSPAYPFVSLSEALEKAEAVFRQDKRAWTTPEAILSHLDFSAGSGKARRIISAMRQFGLLDEEAGKYRISEGAFKIINLSADSPERWNLIRLAALNPPIIGRTLEIFEGELPSDATLKDHLITEENFNPDSVDVFIRALRETLDFAKIPSVEYNRGDFRPEPSPMPQPHSTQAKIVSPPRSQFYGGGDIPASAGQLPFPLYLSKTQKATLLIPASLTRKEYDLLKKQIDNSLDTIEATILIDDEQPEPEN
jgi:hypothetical protein